MHSLSGIWSYWKCVIRSRAGTKTADLRMLRAGSIWCYAPCRYLSATRELEGGHERDGDRIRARPLRGKREIRPGGHLV